MFRCCQNCPPRCFTREALTACASPTTWQQASHRVSFPGTCVLSSVSVSECACACACACVCVCVRDSDTSAGTWPIGRHAFRQGGPGLLCNLWVGDVMMTSGKASKQRSCQEAIFWWQSHRLAALPRSSERPGALFTATASRTGCSHLHVRLLTS